VLSRLFYFRQGENLENEKKRIPMRGRISRRGFKLKHAQALPQVFQKRQAFSSSSFFLKPWAKLELEFLKSYNGMITLDEIGN
jgi:hypothetical protein